MSGDVAEQVVGLGDELHVGVLDAVVDHLHEMSGAIGADVGHAGHAVDDDVAGLEHGAELVDHGIRAGTGFDHDDRGARLGERGGELLDRFARHEAGLRMRGDEVTGLLSRAVVHLDRVASRLARLRARFEPITARPTTQMFACSAPWWLMLAP